jgi:hypothetical protein
MSERVDRGGESRAKRQGEERVTFQITLLSKEFDIPI